MPDLRISDLTGQTGAGLIDADLFIAARTDSDNYRLTRTEMVAGLVGRTTFSDAAKTVDAADRYVAQTGTMSATRIVTLASAANVPAGAQVVIADESGTVSASNTLEIKAPNPQTIDGVASSTNYPIIRVPYGSMTFRSNGSNWFLIDRKPAIDVQVFTTVGSNTWRKPFGCSRVRLVLIGGGGGGGGSAASGAGGGQAGGLTVVDSLSVADLSATETVSVGGGGAGGTKATPSNGSDGTATWFKSSTTIVANGGEGGNSFSTGGTALGQGTIIGASGGAGANAATTPTAGADGLSSRTSGTVTVAPGGGGGGGGYTDAAADIVNGAAGGRTSKGIGTSALGLSGGTLGTSGPSGTAGGPGSSSGAVTSNYVSGGSGGGGGGVRTVLSPASLTGQNGGSAGTYGGGGGGAGGWGGVVGTLTGADGGNGAQGVAIVESY